MNNNFYLLTNGDSKLLVNIEGNKMKITKLGEIKVRFSMFVYEDYYFRIYKKADPSKINNKKALRNNLIIAPLIAIGIFILLVICLFGYLLIKFN